MARLGRDEGKSEKARDLLASVYRSFIEGFETRDLKEAEALPTGLHEGRFNLASWQFASSIASRRDNVSEQFEGFAVKL